MLSLAGTVETPGEGAVGPYWNVVRLGVPKQEGVALASRGGNGQIVLLEQQRDGTLVEATDRLLGDAMTNGGHAVIVADFKVMGSTT